MITDVTSERRVLEADVNSFAVTLELIILTCTLYPLFGALYVPLIYFTFMIGLTGFMLYSAILLEECVSKEQNRFPKYP